MNYENMLIRYDNLNVVEMDLSDVQGLKGLCYNDNIAIEKTLSQAEKSCVLAEELGHYYTSVGNILDQTDIANRKQEYRARFYGYNLKIGLMGIVQAYTHGCRNLYEMAEYLEVTEEYLKEAIECYRSKYGEYTRIDNYVIYFIPCLAVLSMT